MAGSKSHDYAGPAGWNYGAAGCIDGNDLDRSTVFLCQRKHFLWRQDGGTTVSYEEGKERA